MSVAPVLVKAGLRHREHPAELSRETAKSARVLVASQPSDSSLPSPGLHQPSVVLRIGSLSHTPPPPFFFLSLFHCYVVNLYINLGVEK